MHPLFGRLAPLAAYLGLWSLVGLAAALTLVLRVGWTPQGSVLTALPVALAYGVVCLAAWYVCRAFPLSGNAWRVLLAHVGAASLTGSVWVMFARGWAGTVGNGPPWSRDVTVLLSTVAVLLFLLSSAVHYVFIALEDQEAARRQALESAVLAREAELRALRAQVNPHFLFNSLHSIGALAGTRPVAARDMAIALGEFLRQSLRLGGLAGVPLQEEVELMGQYLAIEQVRFGDRLRVHIDVEPDAGTTRVPPLLLQPLVENAIKHGVAGLLDDGVVSITARVGDGQVHVTVVNAFDPEVQSPAGTGTGLRNVRDRLATHYGPAATFRAAADGERFSVTLTYPCEQARHEESRA